MWLLPRKGFQTQVAQVLVWDALEIFRPIVLHEKIFHVSLPLLAR
jgi:hypothetical protein